MTPPAPAAPDISRRTVVAGAAWAVPVIVSVTATPAFAAASASPAAVTTTTPGMQTPAAGTAIVTAVVTDASGARLAGQPVSFTGPTGSTFTPATATTDGSGTATSTLRTADAWALPGSTVTVTALSSGVSGVATLTALGANAYAVGGNASRKAGTPGSGDLSSPTQLSLVFPSRIVSMVTGSAFSLALLKDGTVWSVGSNALGQLGDGTTTDRATWARVVGVANVTQIAAADSLSMALLSDGTIRAWGDNSDGQLGDGSTVPNSPTPVTVTGIGTTTSKAVQIALGYASSYALLSDGSVRSWGNNDEGQLGNGGTTPRNTPGPLVYGPTGQRTRITQISAGAYSAYALLTNGTITSWGNNNRGRLGDGTTTNSNLPTTVSGITTATQVVAGFVSAYALLSDGTVKAWGGNEQGQLGNGTTDYATAYSTPQAIPGLSRVTQLSAASFGAYALTSDNAVYAWGSNAATSTTATPTVVSGASNATRLQDNSSEASTNTLFLIVGDRTIRFAPAATQLSAGMNGRLGVTVSDPASGAGMKGQTVTFSTTIGSISPDTVITDSSGNVDTSFTAGDTWTPPGTVITTTASSAGYATSLRTTVLGANAYAVGANDTGASGSYGGAGTDSTSSTLTQPTQLSKVFPSPIVALAGGWGFSAALLQDGTVWTVGANSFGQLGDGTTSSRTRWGLVPNLTGVKSIAVGGRVVIAGLTDGRVAWWGSSMDQDDPDTRQTTPQLVPGISTATEVAVNADGDGAVAVALCADKKVYSWGSGILGDGTRQYRSTPGVVPGISDAVHVAASSATTFALLSDGTIKSWGRDSDGTLGNGSVAQTGPGWVSPATATTPVSVSGITTALQIAASARSVYAVLADGTVRSWGWNASGQLGDGTTTNRNTPVIVKYQTPVGLANLTVAQIGTCRASAYAVDSNGDTWAWGDNANGQLGDGSTNNRTRPSTFLSGTQPISRIGTNNSSDRVFLVTR